VENGRLLSWYSHADVEKAKLDCRGDGFTQSVSPESWSMVPAGRDGDLGWKGSKSDSQDAFRGGMC
jgi:hypothetical protein